MPSITTTAVFEHTHTFFGSITRVYYKFYRTTGFGLAWWFWRYCDNIITIALRDSFDPPYPSLRCSLGWPPPIYRTKTTPHRLYPLSLLRFYGIISLRLSIIREPRLVACSIWLAWDVRMYGHRWLNLPDPDPFGWALLLRSGPFGRCTKWIGVNSCFLKQIQCTRTTLTCLWFSSRSSFASISMISVYSESEPPYHILITAASKCFSTDRMDERMFWPNR